ncbi:MAG: hypothetical protein M1836_005037 [Candelina mexicana]|nr:MAG: hypothetical protein M1836_005037 [Candelina mexicana]
MPAAHLRSPNGITTFPQLRSTSPLHPPKTSKKKTRRPTLKVTTWVPVCLAGRQKGGTWTVGLSIRSTVQASQRFPNPGPRTTTILQQTKALPSPLPQTAPTFHRRRLSRWAVYLPNGWEKHRRAPEKLVCVPRSTSAPERDPPFRWAIYPPNGWEKYRRAPAKSSSAFQDLPSAPERDPPLSLGYLSAQQSQGAPP